MVTFDCHSNIVYSDIEGCAFKPMAKVGFQIDKIQPSLAESGQSPLTHRLWAPSSEYSIENHKKQPPDLRTNHIPNAHPDEVFNEKSPEYARGDRESLRNNAKRMLEANPKMKLFAFISGS